MQKASTQAGGNRAYLPNHHHPTASSAARRPAGPLKGCDPWMMTTTPGPAKAIGGGVVLAGLLWGMLYGLILLGQALL